MKWHDDMKTECTKALETAADVWTEATEYDSCDDFVGKIGDTWFHLQFQGQMMTTVCYQASRAIRLTDV